MAVKSQIKKLVNPITEMSHDNTPRMAETLLIDGPPSAFHLISCVGAG
jgi:hypothetical protein